jgi:hypothetical protein
MADPTRAEFLTRFPEFNEQTVDVVDGALSEAIRFCPTTGWNKTNPAKIRNDAIQYLAAHSLAMRTMQIGMQVGSVSGQPTGDRIDATLYGQEYKRLLDSQPHCGFSY